MRAISQKENVSLNILKGVACICVVWIHCPFPGTAGKVITGFARFAVPLFFAISGYFVYDKEPEKIYCKIKHIAKILIVTEGFYFIWYFIRGCIRGGRYGVVEWIRKTLTLEAVMNCIVFQKTIIIDVAWFLLALLLAYMLTLGVNKYACWKSMFRIIPILLFLNEIIARTAPSICPDGMRWYWNANLWLLGWPCYVIGYWIRINQRKLLNIATEKWLMLITVSFLLNLVEVFMPGTSWFYISNIPFMIGSMVLCLKHPVFIRHRGGETASVCWQRTFPWSIYLAYVCA
ncbi:MAG: acyltransferase family protein [Lachnospiraceae bacterium]|nr:acyltransferase family protein [Lachnospiraceae bacterium]